MAHVTLRELSPAELKDQFVINGWQILYTDNMRTRGAYKVVRGLISETVEHEQLYLTVKLGDKYIDYYGSLPKKRSASRTVMTLGKAPMALYLLRLAQIMHGGAYAGASV